jgi:predicted O-methyltransferase YrrM
MGPADAGRKGLAVTTDPSVPGYVPDIGRLAVEVHGAAQKPGELSALCKLLEAARPRVVVEIGVWLSGTLWAWSQLPGPPRVIAIDIEPKTNLHGAEFIQGDSTSFDTARRLYDLLGGQPVDFLHIDGGHEYEQAAADYWIYSRLVRPGGLIAIHDIWKIAGPAMLWKEIPGEKQEFIDPEPEWGGIGVVRRA